MIFNPRLNKMNWFVRYCLTGNWANAITLAPFGIYFKHREDIINPRIINHELIHWKQQLEMLIIFFYIWYLIEWLIKLVIFRKRAYMNLSFEREAYNNECDFSYLNDRKSFSWFRRILK